MTPEQEELDRKFQGALMIFNAQLDYLRRTKAEDDNGYSAAVLCEYAIENVMEVYNDWKNRISSREDDLWEDIRPRKRPPGTDVPIEPELGIQYRLINGKWCCRLFKVFED